MIIRVLQILMLLFLLDRTAYAWVVYDDGRYTIESQEVEEHIENVYLTDDQKISLFNKAGRDYQKYQIEVQNWLESRFPTGVKELSFYKLVEKITYIESQRLGYYIAFRNADEVTLRNIRFRLFDQLTTKVNARVYNNEIGLDFRQKADKRRAFAKDLVQKGYPRRAGTSLNSVYQDWYQDQVNKLEKQATLELTAQGIKEFEGFIQAQGYEFRFASPLEVNQAYNDANDLLNRWKGENRSHTDTFRFFKANPSVNALVKDFYPESPRFLAIEKIKEKYPDRLDEIKQMLKDNKAKLTERSLIGEMISIRDMAKEMLQDQLSDSDLDEGKEMMMKEYQSTGEYHFLYTARAFDLAKSIRGMDDATLNASIETKVKSTLENIFNNMEVAIENDTLFSDGYSKYSISEAAKKFATTFIASGSLKEHESKLLASAVWIMKLKFESLFADFENVVIFEMRDLSEAKMLVERTVREQQRNDVRRAAIEDYTLNMFIKIRPSEDESVTGSEVFDFLFVD
jgi:hypothetical protein